MRRNSNTSPSGRGVVWGVGFNGGRLGFPGAGVSVVRKPRWTLDLHSRYGRLWYDGFQATSLSFGLGASQLPLQGEDTPAARADRLRAFAGQAAPPCRSAVHCGSNLAKGRSQGFWSCTQCLLEAVEGRRSSVGVAAVRGLRRATSAPGPSG